MLSRNSKRLWHRANARSDRAGEKSEGGSDEPGSGDRSAFGRQERGSSEWLRAKRQFLTSQSHPVAAVWRSNPLRSQPQRASPLSCRRNRRMQINPKKQHLPDLRVLSPSTV
ncbi:hypothetical protein EMEDMD4_1280072 [Sinorhizobium medicae]|uniref:Uncharacterized protein n=1 Tax=Sinorhizobium medicae TaxID=110321 RepID=A0A508WQT9_9HYPH|nr:hypothetical protein EMEDMD4_1280072 [Sinorhizobium medicae]